MFLFSSPSPSPSSDDMNSSSKPTYTQILVASSVGLIIAAALHYRIRKLRDKKIIPRKRLTDTGQVLSIEKFSHYVGNINLSTLEHKHRDISFRSMYGVDSHTSCLRVCGSS